MADYEVHISTTAEKDILSIMRYISVTLREPKSAERTYRAIKEKIMSLKHMPDRHGVVREEPFTHMGLRKLFAEIYTIFYMIDEEIKAVHIVRVLYNRREWQYILEME